MADLQELQDLVSQIAKPERTIQCIPDGIGFEQFATICGLPGAPENVKQLIVSSVAQLRRGVSAEQENNTILQEILNILIEKVTSFVSLAQYSWLVRTMFALQLLKGLSTKVSSLVRKLCEAVEGINLARLRHSPSVVHTLAKCLMEDIPLDGVNLLHAIKKLAISNSPQLYYTAIALIFAGLDTITHPEKPIQLYRVRGMDELSHYLEALSVERLQQQCDKMQNIYQLLKLLSLYQNMVIMRHAGKRPPELKEEHKCFAELLYATSTQIKSFRQWLENLSALVQPFGNEQDEDYLILADLIHVDMIPLFDDWNQHDGTM